MNGIATPKKGSNMIRNEIIKTKINNLNDKIINGTEVSINDFHWKIYMFSPFFSIR